MHLSATLSQSNTWFVTFDHEKTLQKYQITVQNIFLGCEHFLTQITQDVVKLKIPQQRFA